MGKPAQQPDYEIQGCYVSCATRKTDTSRDGAQQYHLEALVSVLQNYQIKLLYIDVHCIKPR